MMPDFPTAPLHAHLTELRRRVLLSFGVLVLVMAGFYSYADHIFNWITWPLIRALGSKAHDHRFIFTDLPEAFFTHMYLAFFAACVVCIPFILYQIWLFMTPGLYAKERQAVRPFLLLSPFLFYVGILLAFWVVLPMAWSFFLSFELPRSDYLPVVLEPKVSDYVDLVIKLSLGFGLCFQLPVILLVLGKLGLIKAQHLRSKRRYAIVGIFVIAAIMTPPDVFSQIALALPLLVLYELTILALARQEKKSSP